MNVVDLEKERENRLLIDRLGQLMSTPDEQQRLSSALYSDIPIEEAQAMIPNNDAGLLSVRLSKALIERIDDAARETAYREKRKVTRSSLVAEWLETSLQNYEIGLDGEQGHEPQAPE
jgi:hypothetical protein